MEKRLQGLLAGVLIGALLTSGVVFAKQASETISVIYDNIKILIDGKEYRPTDGNGNEVEPFIYNGTTYLPVRAIANAFDKEVDWEAQTSTVTLGSKHYDWLCQMGYVDYSTTRVASEVYSIDNGLKFVVTNPDFNKRNEEIDQTSISYLLNNSYKTFITNITVKDEYGAGDIKPSVLKIYGDGNLLYTSPRVTENSDDFSIELDVSNVKLLKFEITTELQNTSGIAGTDRKRAVIMSDARLSKK